MPSEPFKYLTLRSRDGYEFVICREACLVSPVIKAMTDSSRGQDRGLIEAQTGVCTFGDISGVVLEKVVDYFQYWYKNRGKEDVPDMDIPVEYCLEILMAADFLGLDGNSQ